MGFTEPSARQVGHVVMEMPLRHEGAFFRTTKERQKGGNGKGAPSGGNTYNGRTLGDPFSWVELNALRYFIIQGNLPMRKKDFLGKVSFFFLYLKNPCNVFVQFDFGEPQPH